MPRKTKKTQLLKPEISIEPQKTEKKKIKLFSVKNIILLVVMVIIVLAWKFKGNFVAALVNGQPVSRFELNDQLVKQYGDQTLDNIINERLIIAGVRQKGIFVTSAEINDRVKQIEEKLKDKISLADALKAQGLTESAFRKQLEIQISIEKMFDKDATVSSKEVDDYLAQNKEAFKTATDQAAIRTDIESTLKQQKSSDLFNSWFTEIRKSASIKKFL
ncbi:SurA N-terminal domain-containing protein [Candidatus Microgenomates bacterium]|nr:SurA N-terminal domain-containing protein [Candidatus Microgenomates bacterium]